VTALSTDLPKFVDDDPERMREMVLVRYEAMTGKRPLRSQTDYALADMVGYGVSLVRSAINSTGWQNLVRGASAPMLDLLGVRVGVYRLPAQSARTTVRIVFQDVLIAPLTISAFTQAAAGQIAFQTSLDRVVPKGATQVDLPMLAVTPGLEANDLAPGQVNALLDDIGVDVAQVTNLQTTSGGAVEEDDDRLREAILDAPAAFSTAGSEMAYRFHTKRAHQDIVAVAVLSPVPGQVDLYPLTRYGLPDEAMLALVAETCSGKKVRPLTDHVRVFPPTLGKWQWKAQITRRSSATPDTTLEAAEHAAHAFVQTHEQALGLDVVRSQLIAALSAPDVYDVELLEPAADIAVPDEGWAQCTGIAITLAEGSRD